MSDPRDEILEFAGDACVHASAGTGKTSLLVDKFCRGLTTEEKDGRFTPVEGLLAITFSEKAADEMRRRIAEKIAGGIQTAEAMEPGTERTRLLGHLVKARRRFSQAFISTIHSFCARILREHPVEAGIDPLFEIMDDADSGSLLNRALMQFLLAKLRGGDPAVTDLACRYGFSRQGGYESSLFTMVGSLFHLLRVSDLHGRAGMGEYGEFMARAEDRLSSHLALAVEKASATAAGARKEKAKAIVDEVLHGLKLLGKAAAEDREAAVRMADRLETAMNLTNFRGNPDARALKDAIREARDTLVSILAQKSALQLADLIEEFRGHYHVRVKRRVLLDFDDLQELALALLSRNPKIRDDYRALFRKILVDEFQDVNRLQKEIVYQIASPGERKLFIVGDPKQAIYGFRGGEVRVFGEVRKEICDAGGRLFLLKTNFRATSEITNFTNSFFSAHAPDIFTEEDKCEALRGSKGSPAIERITFAPRDSADENRFSEARAVARRIHELVAGAPGGDKCSFRDIAVLFRKFTVLPLYESAFRMANIPSAIYRGAGFFQSREVTDIVCALSFIGDPTDLISWVAALRSPLAGCSDETVLALRRGLDGRLYSPLEPPDAPTMERLVSDPLEREKSAAFIHWTAEVRRMKDRMSISEMIEAVLEQSGYMGVLGAQPNGLQKVANVLKLVEMARSMESSGNASPVNFIRDVSSLIEGDASEPQAVVSGPDEDVVRVMTVHQAKGLEFPVVVLVDIDGEAGSSPSPVVFEQRRGFALKYVDRSTLRSFAGTVHSTIKEYKELKEDEDATRLFYVGCTRARDRLILSGCPMKKGSGRAKTVDLFREANPEHFFDPVPVVPKEAPPGGGRVAYDVLRGMEIPSVPQDAIKPGLFDPKKGAGRGGAFIGVSDLLTFRRCRRHYLLGNLLKVPAPKEDGGTTAMEIGTAVHAVLERLDFSLPPRRYEAAARRAVGAKMGGFAAGKKREALEGILGLYDVPFMKRLREGKATEAGREIPFCFNYRGEGDSFFMKGKVDLLLRNEKGAPCVVDYKFMSAKEPGAELKLQLEIYALALARFMGTSEVSCALAMLKGKPRVHEWEMGSGELDRLEQRLLHTSREIVRFEEDNRAARADRPLERIACPDPRCGYSVFCGQGNERTGVPA